MNVYNFENIRKGDKAMQKRSKKQQNTLINSVLKAVVGMYFAVPELLHSQASPLQYRCKAH
jgi:hypothetical protein